MKKLTVYLANQLNIYRISVQSWTEIADERKSGRDEEKV